MSSHAYHHQADTHYISVAADANQLSPARLPAAITVAASDKADKRWVSSNYGTCVDLYGPGVAVTSAMDTSDTATMTASGTSMACPHVSGVAALYLQSNPTALPNEVSIAHLACFVID